MIALAATLLLLGIPGISTTPYTGPIDGQKARVTLVNETASLVGVAFYKEAAECRHRQVLKPMLKAGQSRTVDIPTSGEVSITLGQDLSISGGFAGGIKIVGCTDTFTMQAEPGAAYTVRIQNTKTMCIMDIAKTAYANGPLAEPQVAPHRIREYRTPWGEAGPFCR